jgi:hypothetical protein
MVIDQQLITPAQLTRRHVQVHPIVWPLVDFRDWSFQFAAGATSIDDDGIVRGSLSLAPAIGGAPASVASSTPITWKLWKRPFGKRTSTVPSASGRRVANALHAANL